MKSSGKWQRVVGLLLVVLLCAGGLASQQAKKSPAERLYAEALLKKDADGDLQAAIKLFTRIVTDYPNDRKTASQSQLQIGLCYEKLGNTEAEKAFRKVLEKYADQPDAVQAAKSRLSLLSGAAISASAKSTGLVLRQLSLPPRLPSPSPDGKFLAFIDWGTLDQKKNGDLVILDLASGNKKTLVDMSADSPMREVQEPVSWASESKQIAFTKYDYDSRKSDLFTVDASGSNLRMIPLNADFQVSMLAGWSPDRRFLIAALSSKERGFSLQRIALATGDLLEIKSTGKTRIINSILSPDGRYIAYSFSQGAPQNGQINLLATDGSQDVEIVKHPSGAGLLGWSPDGRNILFSSNRAGSPAVWIQGISEGRLFGPPTLVQNFSGNLRNLGMTKSGSLYLAEGPTSGSDVYIAQLDLQTGMTTKAPEMVEPKCEGCSSTPFWSSGGDVLGYLFSNPPTGAYLNTIRLLAPKTGVKRDLTLTIDMNRLMQPPRWSVDGKHIYIVGNAGSPSKRGLFQIDASSGQSELISEGMIYGWSSDGTIAYLLQTENPGNTSEVVSTIVRRDLKTGEELKVLQGSRGESILCTGLSPDGKWIGLNIMDFKQNASCFCILPSEGGSRQQITPWAIRGEFIGAHFFWDPSGSGALFERKGSGATSGLAYLPSFAGKEMRKLNLEMPRINGLTFHPDGKTIAFNTLTPGKTKYWIIANFLPAKK
jgi:Tol biopolymer transport system component